MKVLACDIGGTRIKLGLIENGAVVKEKTIPAPPGRNLVCALQAVKQGLHELCAEAGVPLSSCAGLALGIPALVDTAGCRITAIRGKYADAAQIDLPAWCRSELNLPLALENDARMALIGEWRHGAGQGYENIVIITLGTGIGTAALIDGMVLRGKHGLAGCFGGHWTLNINGRPCACGSVGCAETQASTEYLHTLAPSEGEKLPDFTAVFTRAGQGDPVAVKIRDRALKVWGMAAVNLVHAYEPELIIVTGGVLRAGTEEILGAIRENLLKHATMPGGPAEVRAGALGDHAALLAAEWLLENMPHGSNYPGKRK